MGLDCSLLTKHIMELFVVLSVVACSYAAPVADADAQVLAYGHGLLGGVYHAGVAPAATVAVAPATYHVAAPAVAEVKTVEVKAAPAVAVAPTVAVAPAAYHVAAPAVHVATAPVVHQVGYQVHHQVHHVPQVTVQKHTSTHTTHHVINHAPVVGAFTGLVPVAAAAAAPVEAEAEAAPVVEEA